MVDWQAALNSSGRSRTGSPHCPVWRTVAVSPIAPEGVTLMITSPVKAFPDVSTQR